MSDNRSDAADALGEYMEERFKRKPKPPKAPKEPRDGSFGDFFRHLAGGVRDLFSPPPPIYYPGVQKMAEDSPYDSGGPSLPGPNQQDSPVYPRQPDPIGGRRNIDITLNPAGVAMGRGAANMSQDQANMPDSGSGVGAQGLQPGQGTPERRLVIGLGGGRSASVSVLEGRRFISDPQGNPSDPTGKIGDTHMTVNTANNMLNGDRETINRYKNDDFAQEIGQDLDDLENLNRVSAVLTDMGYKVTDKASVVDAMNDFVKERAKDDPSVVIPMRGARQNSITHFGLMQLQDELKQWQSIYNHRIAE